MNVHDVQKVRQFEHPGAGRKRAKATPKGRQVDPTAAHEIELLLGDRPRRRDLLIEHLHLIQDHYGHLSAAHLAALAAEMKMAQTEVYEVATFYSHFDVVKDGPPPPAVTVACSYWSAMDRCSGSRISALPPTATTASLPLTVPPLAPAPRPLAQSRRAVRA